MITSRRIEQDAVHPDNSGIALFIALGLSHWRQKDHHHAKAQTGKKRA
jgi:hypothetical protein